MSTSAHGPVLFAYDGCELSKLAIDEAGKLDTADARDASLIVGVHTAVLELPRRWSGALRAVSAHSRRSVLIVHREH